MTEHDVAGELIDALDREGEHVDDGVFTLDAAAAFRKLREHQLADPHAYVLLLIEAAWLAGRDRADAGVRVVLGVTTTIEFSGLALELGSLAELFAAALGGVRRLDGEPLRRARILQLLGLAANSALALGPEQLILDASDADGQNHRVRIDPSGELTIEPISSLAPGLVRFQFQARVWGGGSRDRVAAERRALVERCRYTSMPIHVDGRRVSIGPTADLHADSAKTTTVEVRGASIGVAGQTKIPETPTVAWIVNRGVAIRDVVPDGQLGKQAVVEVDLPLDLSHKELIEDATVEAIRSGIRAALAAVPAPKPPRAKPRSAAPRLLGLMIVIGLAVVMFSLSFRTTDDPSAEQPDLARNVASECQANSIEACQQILADPNADPILHDLALEKSCATGDEAACDARRYPSRYQTRRCVAERDDAACQSMIFSAYETHAATGDLDPLRVALSWTCLSVAGPECVEAAWFYHYGFARPEPIDWVEVPDTTEAALLERGCTAGSALACEQRSGPTLAAGCADDDALSCYAIANQLTPESIGAADKACKLALIEGCWAAAVMRARGLSVVADPDAALRDFTKTCEMGHLASCNAARRLGRGQEIRETTVFPSWVAPAGVKRW